VLLQCRYRRFNNLFFVKFHENAPFIKIYILYIFNVKGWMCEYQVNVTNFTKSSKFTNYTKTGRFMVIYKYEVNKMKLTMYTDYSLRVLMYLGTRAPDEKVQIDEIS